MTRRQFMKKWYQWLYLSLCFTIAGIVSCIERKGTVINLIPIGITDFLALIQLICNRKGEKGIKIYRVVSISMIAILIICAVYLIFDTFA